MKKGIHLRDECVYRFNLPKVGTCKAGYLFWPCFYIKLLVLWDAKADVLNKVASELLPDVSLEHGGAYAWVWDLEDGPDTPAEDYVSSADRPFTHVMCITKRPASDSNGLRSSVAHEGLHVTKSALDLRGLKWTKDSEEAYTYQLESIVSRVCELFKTPITKAYRL